MKIEMTDLWKEVERRRDYNVKIGYYNRVDTNIAFCEGRQWGNVQANGLDTPVMNIIKPTRDYKVSSLMSQPVKGRFNVEYIEDGSVDEKDQQILELVEKMNNFIPVKWDKEKMESKLRECMQDGFTTGDYAIYTYWDKNYDTKQDVKGDFKCDVISGNDVLFSNPNNRNVEGQDDIIILGRDTVKNLKEEAKNNKIPESEIMKIAGDKDTEYGAGDYNKIELSSQNDNDKATYAIKYYKKDGKIYYSKSVKGSYICKDKSTLNTRFPLAWGNWEKVRGSFHGISPVTNIIPNQKYINKMYAMIMLWTKFNALGKTIYDGNRITSWSNSIGSAIKVNGDISNAVQQLQPGNLNAGIFQFLELVTSETLKSIGVNDVIMGDVRPENTSAIIAIQKQSAVPLENQQAHLHQFVEDIYLIWADFIMQYYIHDRKISQEIDGEKGYTDFDATMLQDKLIGVTIDIGSSSHWSEIASDQTLENLLSSGHLSLIQFLERMSDGKIPQKDKLIEEIKEKMEMEQQQQAPEDIDDFEQLLQGMSEEQRVMFEQLPQEEQQAMYEEFLNQEQQVV